MSPPIPPPKDERSPQITGYHKHINENRRRNEENSRPVLPSEEYTRLKARYVLEKHLSGQNKGDSKHKRTASNESGLSRSSHGASSSAREKYPLTHEQRLLRSEVANATRKHLGSNFDFTEESAAALDSTSSRSCIYEDADEPPEGLDGVVSLASLLSIDEKERETYMRRSSNIAEASAAISSSFQHATTIRGPRPVYSTVGITDDLTGVSDMLLHVAEYRRKNALDVHKTAEHDHEVNARAVSQSASIPHVNELDEHEEVEVEGYRYPRYSRTQPDQVPQKELRSRFSWSTGASEDHGPKRGPWSKFPTLPTAKLTVPKKLRRSEQSKNAIERL